MVNFYVFKVALRIGAVFPGVRTEQFVSWTGGAEEPIFSGTLEELARHLFVETEKLHKKNENITIAHKTPWDLWSFEKDGHLRLLHAWELTQGEQAEFTKQFIDLVAREVRERTHGRPR